MTRQKFLLIQRVPRFNRLDVAKNNPVYRIIRIFVLGVHSAHDSVLPKERRPPTSAPERCNSTFNCLSALFRSPATAAGVRPRCAAISATEHSCQYCITSASRWASGNAAKASASSTARSTRCAYWLGEDWSATTQPASRADELASASSIEH